MGAQTALDLSGLKLEMALRYHLTANHYPPVPESLVPACLRAIKKANAGEWDKTVRLPSNVRYKNNRGTAPVRDMISNFHLEWFLDQEDEL